MEYRMEIASSATDDPIKAQHAFLLSRLAPSRMFTVLDIGANPVKVAPYRKLLDSGGCHVVGFESQEEAYQGLIAAAGHS